MSTTGKTKLLFSQNSTAWGRTIVQRVNDLGNASTASLNWPDTAEGGSSFAGEAQDSTKNLYLSHYTADFTGSIGTYDPIAQAASRYYTAAGASNTIKIRPATSIQEAMISDGDAVSSIATVPHIKGIVPIDGSRKGPLWEADSIYPTYEEQYCIVIDTPNLAPTYLATLDQAGTTYGESWWEHLMASDQALFTAKLNCAFVHAMVANQYGQIYRNMGTRIQLPYNPVEMSLVASTQTSEYAEADSEYNMTYSRFNRLCMRELSRIENKKVSGDTGRPENVSRLENLMPNMLFESVFKSAENPESMIGTSIDNFAVPRIWRDHPTRTRAAFETNPTAYWDRFQANYLAKVALGAARSSFDDKQMVSNKFSLNHSMAMQTMVVAREHVPLLADLDNRRENYPFYVKVEFKADDTVPFVRAIEEANLMDQLVMWIAGEQGDTATFYEPTEVWDLGIDYDSARPSVKLLQERVNVVKTNRKVLDIDDFFKAVANSGFATKFNNTPHAHSLGSTPSTDAIDCESVKTKLLTHALKGKLKQEFENNAPLTYPEILDSTFNPSDTIAYRIEKINASTGVSVQNIFIPNTNDQGVIKYFDTQVLYGRKYEYRVYAFQAIAEVQYEPQYTTSRRIVDADTATTITSSAVSSAEADNFIGSFNNDGSPLELDTIEIKAEGDIGEFQKIYCDMDAEPDAPYSPNFDGILIQKFKITPRLSIVEVPIYQQEVRIMDSPPLSPEIDIVPFKGNSTELGIFLNSQVGRQEADPIALLETDVEMFESQAEAQRLQPGDYMTFESDGRPQEFQIFRTDKHPTSWRDFSDSLHESVGTSLLTEEQLTTGALYGDNLYSHSAALIDTIEENKKYYYCFRTVDTHGFISNPSEIYEVELVNNEGAIYLLKKEVDFSAPVPKIARKKFKRYLKICPNIQNVMIDTTAYDSAWEGEAGGIELGTTSDSVWGKKFRFIIRSIKTGKEIHINTDFSKGHVITSRELSSED